MAQFISDFVRGISHFIPLHDSLNRHTRPCDPRASSPHLRRADNQGTYVYRLFHGCPPPAKFLSPYSALSFNNPSSAIYHLVSPLGRSVADAPGGVIINVWFPVNL